jgi:hypothetical protein
MKLFLSAAATAFCVLSVLAVTGVQGQAAEPTKIYELRTYTVLPGRMPAMLKRFRNDTTRLFEKHGMVNVGYWTPEGPEGQTRLIYLLAHDSKAAAEKSWQAFKDDPDWHKARDESEKDGKIVEKADSVYLEPADFSKLK